MLNNTELQVNQGANLKLKLGEEQDELFSRTAVCRNRTIGKPLKLSIVVSKSVQ
ncbi:MULTISPECIES: hypothetical protein [Calothrix]|uniref:Transposase n=2 Tax=Calothrix TaxID=1186 RepID=A0ABR8AGF4_9CYAN|nr:MULTISPECIES: hypothetical protein [Calothrix]MBD2198280.1 hypothetical protein [Calothrix parietina FACHB-288]MBD2202851.1 hypothetical protein [Calothrix sp. FACHB-168]MBD2215979.1 hypothetical protein [Calothrix sp. FACHB-1219]MBD2226603.1 hypothetical protein [Calothrix anomala FACHB-343]